MLRLGWYQIQIVDIISLDKQALDENRSQKTAASCYDDFPTQLSTPGKNDDADCDRHNADHLLRVKWFRHE